MGVPAFFKWLCNSCPQAILQANEKQESEEGGVEVDNLYLDMNGIIHPCTHPPPGLNIRHPANEQEMFENISNYLDVLLRIVQPKKLIYFAIDGVAPKAKMNQQRGRRFRAAQEILRNKENRQTLATEMLKGGLAVSESLVSSARWDHNVITPGTEFLERVSNFLKKYIVENLADNALWRGLKIIFSDANTPKEGEHKILEYIRQQRA